MKNKTFYAYPAILYPDADGWSVEFPDLDNCFTSADSFEEALIEAQAVLEDCMYFREIQKDDIPTPTTPEKITPPKGGRVQIVVANMPPTRKAWSNKSVKKTLTIPSWMEEELKKRKDLNVSLILQDAIKRELKIKEPAL